MNKLAIGLLVASVLGGCSKPATELGVATDTPANFAAHWLSEDLILIKPEAGAVSFSLYASEAAQLDEGARPELLVPLKSMDKPAWLATDVPHLQEFTALTLSEPIKDIKSLLKGQLAVAQKNSAGEVVSLSYLQTARVLDALYTSGEKDADEVNDLGATIQGESSQFALWAPTAQAVKVNLYDDSKSLLTSVTMTEDDNGVWRASSELGQGTWYRYELEVYHPRTQAIEKYEVTDPYSLSLSRNSQYSQVVDLASEDTKPANWDKQTDTELSHPESLILYETHIRDFSASDKNLSNPEYAGKYKAFSETASDGAKHLSALKLAGLNTVHLLPTYDISTVDEDPSKVIFPSDPLSKVCEIAPQVTVCDTDVDKTQSLQSLLQSFDPLTGDAQAIIEVIRPYDPYNWGYDPYHYTVPEGSYALNPDGIHRVLEFREMVMSLHEKGFKVIMDVVYNHTFASGLDDKSVLDKVVPNYYHRLNPISGEVEKSTCCENSATENRMMAKLMTDSLVVWARDYKIDGFRFDLMGHQPKAAMLESREAVRAVDPDTYFYGEGWNFGEVANNAQFEQAAQIPLAGTEIGTFTDRLRDAVRGGSSFVSADELRFGQGIANGLIVQPNELQTEAQQEAQLAEYYLSMDQIRVGLAGNLANFPLINAEGEAVTGKDIPYGGAPTGYALDPADTINYVSKHDNQTLWDNNHYRLPFEATTEQRVRYQNLSLAYPLLAQGIPFLHMGGELLRSKSFLRDSYDYGDWFNAVDFGKQSNNYNVGLPPAVKDEANWDVITRIIQGNEGRDLVKPAHIEFASKVFMDFIAIRASSHLFSLQTEQQVIDRIAFHNTGKEQQMGLIAMSIADGQGVNDLDAAFNGIMVIFNNAPTTQTFSFEGAGEYSLHPRQANGADPVTASAQVKADSFVIPGLTAAVFVK